MLKKVSLFSTLLVVLGFFLFSPAQVSSATDDFEVVRATVDQWLSSKPKLAMSADAVYETLNDGNPDNDPFILSVRNPSHYAFGHLPGAVNSPLRQLAKSSSLRELPTSQRILAYGYDAPDGQTAMTALNLMGYQTDHLKWGMMAWSANDKVLAHRRLDPSTIPNYPVETVINQATATYSFPTLKTGASGQPEIMRTAVNNFLSSGKALTINREEFYAIWNDGDPSNDPFLLSVRPAAQYDVGHIPGAINIPLFELGKAENLAKLPSSRPIVAYCNSSHMGAVATTVLNVLGYDVINLEGGISTWSTNTELISTKPFSSAQQRDYPVEASVVSDPPASEAKEVSIDWSKVRLIINKILR
jgi:rhodanese-related sulfurtransferase